MPPLTDTQELANVRALKPSQARGKTPASGDWAAVGEAVDERMMLLGLTQLDVAERSRISLSIIREVQHHSVERRRYVHTLEALSVALDWHQDHLTALLHGVTPPEPVIGGPDGVSRLVRIEERLDRCLHLLADIKARLDTWLGHVGIAAPRPELVLVDSASVSEDE